MTKGPATKVNWQAIRDEYEAGQTISDLSRKYPVSRQRISYVAKKEGWVTDLSTGRGVAKGDNGNDEATETVRLPVAVLTELEGSAFSQDRGQTILNSLCRSGHYGVAAATAGIARQTLTNWREKSPTFDVACQQALSKRALRHLGSLDKAEERGDVKAIEMWLRANPLTREEFAKEEGSGGPAKIVVNIAVPAGVDNAKGSDTITIEGQTVNIDAPSEAVNE